MLPPAPTNRERFLAAIAERVAPDRVQALYLFAPIRQGPVETGVAVIAVDPLVAVEAPAEVAIEATTEAAVEAPTEFVEGVPVEVGAEVGADGAEAESGAVVVEEHTEAEVPVSGPVPAAQPFTPGEERPKPVVLTARYRHTLKGADRGKWALEILEQADAPLVTVELVIQGVQMRLDESVQPERLGADALRAAVAEGLWTPPQR